MSITTPALRAFHNDPQIKAHYLARVQAHRAADEIVHGTYWQYGKGCAIGCTLHSSNHDAYESELGIPSALAYLEDTIFERLHSPQDCAWPTDFLQAIPVGADLADMTRQFLLALLTDAQHGVRQYVLDAKWTAQREAIDTVIALLRNDQRVSAAEAAEAATRAAAEDAAWAAAWDAAEADAEAAAEAAARAAWAAEGAWAAHFAWQRDILLTLLAQAPVEGK